MLFDSKHSIWDALTMPSADSRGFQWLHMTEPGSVVVEVEVELREFFKTWLDWIDMGAPLNSYMFSRNGGLCQAWRYWYCRPEADRYKSLLPLRDALRDLLAVDFAPDVRDYPFGGPHTYKLEELRGLGHTNEQRITWARKQLAKLEATNAA